MSASKPRPATMLQPRAPWSYAMPTPATTGAIAAGKVRGLAPAIHWVDDAISDVSQTSETVHRHDKVAQGSPINFARNQHRQLVKQADFGNCAATE